MGGAIRLLNFPLFGHHGVTKAERDTGTLLEFDVELEVDLDRAAASDHVEDTVNYMAIHEEVRELVKDRHFHLLESLAAAIADRLIERFGAKRAGVRVRKSNLPLSGGRIEVEVQREAGNERPGGGKGRAGERMRAGDRGRAGNRVQTGNKSSGQRSRIR